MRDVHPWPGLPVGRGLLWRCPRTRALMLALAAAAATASSNSLAGPWGCGLPARVVGAALALLLVGACVALWHQRHLAVRLLVGGACGVGGAAVASAMARALGAHPWHDLGATGPDALLGGALAGMAFATVAGRAHWLWGLAFGAAQGAVVWELGATPASSAVGLAWHLVYGAALGWLNQRVQPPPPASAKILFFRDYKPQRGRSSEAPSRPVR
ncbi:MAG: hypothetical protein VKS61_16600 [Candidatus Sericytochromatia bacterium]|nr:hypothetical protein [Candidatus Sericytochromatia bacterium]